MVMVVMAIVMAMEGVMVVAAMVAMVMGWE